MLPVHHLHLLLTKELIVIWRSKVWSVVEIAIPLIISVPLIALVLQNSSSVKHEAQFWESFQVTGDWRDIDRRLGNMQSIYSYCGILSRRNLGLVFPNNMDEKEISWTAREIEFRYLMNNSALHSHFFELNVKIFPTEAAMMEELLEDYHRSFMCTKYIAGIIFDEYNSSTLRLSYTIRIRQTEDPQTQWYVGDDIWESGGPYGILDDHFLINMVPNYWSLGILSLQYAIDTVFLKGTDDKKSNDSKFQLSLERIPEPPYFEKSVVKFLSFLIIFWQLFTLPCILHTVANIVSEKHSGIKNHAENPIIGWHTLIPIFSFPAFLTVMGMRSSTFYIAHAIIGFIKIAVVLLSCTVILLPQIQTISSWLFFSTNFIYGAGAASFALLMSCIFHTPGAATKGTIVIWLVTIVLTRLQVTDGSVLLNIILSLNLNYAFICAHRAMQDYMNRDEYLGIYNMFENTIYIYSFGTALIMMTFDILWMSLLAIYLDNVYPSGDLPRKQWFFFLHQSNNKHQQCTFDDSSDAQSDNIQKYEGNDQADIDIRHLTKTYAVQPAVDSMSFRAYRGEITVLLGHNGAGKSTTFSLITGLISPTSGSIYICGSRMESHSIDHCQREIGFCPQYNALFNLLTVREHLEMFRKLSGNTVDCVMELMTDMQLDNVADIIAENLSGGMKRKLCVGISLVGGRRIILLDEPTAGMDPASRQAVVELLQRCKRERTILLTTHCMDEADLLGDRIAIMVRGRLFCAGTSEFLKNRFGTGYLLSIDLVPRQSSHHSLIQKEQLLSIIRKHVPETKKQSITPQQMTVLLPTESKKSFPNLFIDLEQNAEKYGINSFGLSLNTLEQVFLKVGELEDADSTVPIDIENMAEQQASILCSNSFIRTGLLLWIGQVIALLRKRFICYRKQWPRFIWQIVFPVTVLLVVVFYMKNLSTRDEKRHEILLNAGRINPSVVLLQLENPETLFGRNVLQIVRNITGYSYKLVPPSESMELSLAKLPKVPPPVSIAVMYNTKNSYIAATAFFNAKARYGPVIATTLISNARLGQSAGNKNFLLNIAMQIYSIKVSFLPYGNVSDVSPLVSLNSHMFLIAPVLIIIFAFVSSGFVAYIVDDLNTNFLHQQLRTRLNTFIYWLSVIISDLILYAFVCTIFIVILNEWLSNLKFDLLLLWLMYLWPTLPLVYCVAFLINHPARAYIFLIIITLIVALCASIISYIMMFIKPKLFPYLHTAFLFTLPTYSMSYGLIMILVADVNKDTSGLYSWEKLGRIYILMACSGFLFWIILIIINFKPAAIYMHDLLSVMRRTTSNLSMYESNLEDIDVKKERECISQKRNVELSLAVRNLNKYYGNLHAVRDLTFGIEPGECFGLLGVNGAGKTTTFDMLTGVSIPDGGEAFINGRSILKKQLIGFCPQFDALHPKLTARQTLQLLASLYGFANPMKRVETLLEAVSLTAHADICVEFLSGGQRRRLSLAVALISQTDLILLDEPTAGIDPKARRQIWCLLNAVREKRRAMLLTSHSMTECEALCNRIGIMDQGSLIAIGTPQHIKTRFGEKYTLIITISDQCRREDLICLVKKIFPDSIEKDTYRTCLLWDITKGESDRWSQMYGKLCQLAAQFPWITDYSLTQTTLEGAFLQLSQREK
uniref:ABC transporter domain-containing protein n=1 Tax=Onchocerca volvulus TaxID=6282 RepID=A0A8R1XY06_ONCVO